MEKLHPGAKWLFRIKAYFAGIPLLIFLLWFGGFFGIMLETALKKGAGAIVTAILISFLFYIIAIIIIGEIYSRMAYNRWFYEFAKDELKLERGIIWKRYSNVPYQRVQNVDIHRGILARMLGFSTIDIQTAGFHMAYGRRGGGARSEGHIPAVSPKKAEQIREMLMKKISKRGGAGGGF